MNELAGEMNAETHVEAQKKAPRFANGHLLGDAFAGLEPMVKEIKELGAHLDELRQLGDETTQRSMRSLRYQLSTIEPTITMIGQVKAGKTTLVNALCGWPGLLPADVNPWTSVVTSLHFDPAGPEGETRAKFQFFQEDEWDRLINRGGRLGELASRAGADDELSRVREQVAEMREKSRRRLGKKFELLLGQTHDYGYFDSDLIERYVCLGDDFEDDLESGQQTGRFADITRAADLFLSRPEFPMRLCIRDTPGVNDTFMMREQITIRATRESRICVMVLSAHQALTSVDMALIRLVANVRSREVVVFVNRIDELNDPSTEIPQIRESIRKTLRDHQGPEDAQIIFGSGHWANIALASGADGVDEASAEALVRLAESEPEMARDSTSIEDLIWHLSGVPALCDALSERIIEGVGHEAMQKAARVAVNHTRGMQTSERMAQMRQLGHALADVDTGALDRELQKIEMRAVEALETRFETVIGDFDKRLERSHRSFLERATSALIQHLETKGHDAVWQYDPTGLRVLLRTSYRVFSTNSRRVVEATLTQAADEIKALYSMHLGDAAAGFEIETPEPDRAPPPVLLGQTIALDLKGSIWSRWWRRRRGARAYAKEFAELIKGETDPIISGLRDAHAASIREDAIKLLHEFLGDQRDILSSVAESATVTETKSYILRKERSQTLESTLEHLSRFAA